MQIEQDRVDVAIIGAGQAGLAVGSELACRRLTSVILEEDERIGDSWRRRWDSLSLFTPISVSHLPGRPLSVPERGFATKDQMADYLEEFAILRGLPIRTGVSVSSVERIGDRYRIRSDHGVLTAGSVVVATGANRIPRVPDFASDARPAIQQMHAADYRSPASVPPGDVLVVGSGTSGIQIAVELAATHSVTIAGRPTPRVPAVLYRRFARPYWWYLSSVLTLDTPVGRQAARHFHDRGAPLVGIRRDALVSAGVTRVDRISGFVDGDPMAGGVRLTPSTIIWATGYQPRFDWISGLDVDDRGWPVTRRGVVAALPGLYLVGMPFQYGLTSATVGGVGRDARYIADRVVARESTRRRIDRREPQLVG